MTFAYVELVGMKGYVEVFPIYDSYKVPALSRWVRLAARDELYHSLNLLNILRIVHADKLLDVTQALREIVRREDERSEDYAGTFLFDHDPPSDVKSLSFLKKCANDICHKLDVPLAFENIIID